MLICGDALSAVTSMCEGNAQDMQHYIREQPDRKDNLDGITIIVEYMVELSTYYPAAATTMNEDKINLFGEGQESSSRDRDIMESIDIGDDSVDETTDSQGVMAGFNKLIVEQTTDCEKARDPFNATLSRSLDSLSTHGRSWSF